MQSSPMNILAHVILLRQVGLFLYLFYSVVYQRIMTDPLRCTTSGLRGPVC